MSTAEERHNAFWKGTALESPETMEAADFDCCRNGEHQPAGTSYPLHSDQFTQDMLSETIAGMLDNALHLEACWISEDETRCVCIIGALRAALPRCGHVEMVGAKKLTRQCLSTVHPSESYKHVFGVV
jgi:hypothetical protein